MVQYCTVQKWTQAIPMFTQIPLRDESNLDNVSALGSTVQKPVN